MSARFVNSPVRYFKTAFFVLGIIFVIGLSIAPSAFSQKVGAKALQVNAEGKFPKGVNPHDQINDEGELDEQVCILCHEGVPDASTADSIYDVKFLFDKFKDLKEMCFTCHPERMHPGGGTFATSEPKWKKWGAPNHWVKPNEIIEEKMDSMLSDDKFILPLDPKTEEITCATCHNPHELGVLKGPANVGADNNSRLRKLNSPICLMCHDL